jgi:hypothetical protein
MENDHSSKSRMLHWLDVSRDHVSDRESVSAIDKVLARWYLYDDKNGTSDTETTEQEYNRWVKMQGGMKMN